jgi:competence protein ComEA
MVGLLAMSFLAVHSPAKKKPPAAPINLNTADSEQLQLVPGIGPATAEKILQMRKAYGSFKSVDDLLAIRGIGPKRLDKMRRYLTIGKATAPSKPASSSKPAASPPQSNSPKCQSGFSTIPDAWVAAAPPAAALAPQS